MKYTVWTKQGDLNHGAAYNSIVSLVEFERHEDDGLEVWTFETEAPSALERMFDTDDMVIRYEEVA